MKISMKNHDTKLKKGIETNLSFIIWVLYLIYMHGGKWNKNNQKYLIFPNKIEYANSWYLFTEWDYNFTSNYMWYIQGGE